MSDEKKMHELLSFYDRPNSDALLAATRLYLEQGDPAHNLLTAIIFQREAVHAIERNNYTNAFNNFSSVNYSIGRYSGAIGQKKATAKANALIGHAETHAMRKEVIAFWEQNISFELSNEKAALILIKQFPLAFRTLSGYVSAAKKIRRASRL